MSIPDIHGANVISVNRKFARLRGFSLFELMVVVIVVGIVGLIFFSRVLVYQEIAEKTAVEITVMHLRSSLRYRTAELMLQHKEKEIINLVGGNPMQWVEMPPPGYIGELKQVQWDRIAPGSWYFDRDKGEIVYRVRRGAHFNPGSAAPQKLHFRIVASSKQLSTDGSTAYVEGAHLQLLESYEWFSRDKGNVLP